MLTRPYPLHLLNAALLIGLWGGSLWAYPHLPGEIPMHYGLSGAADRFAETTLGRWLTLPLVATLTAGITYGGATLVRALPGALSVPSPHFDALNDAGRQRVAVSVQVVLSGIATLVLVLFGALQGGNYVVATQSLSALPGWVDLAIWGSIAAILAVTVGFAVYSRRLVERLARQPAFTDPNPSSADHATT